MIVIYYLTEEKTRYEPARLKKCCKNKHHTACNLFAGVKETEQVTPNCRRVPNKEPSSLAHIFYIN